VATGKLEAWVHQARDLHRRRLAELLRSYLLQELASQGYVLMGESAQLIPELATRPEVGLIVTGTVSRTGIGGL
jgi:hypothetical protein